MAVFIIHAVIDDADMPDLIGAELAADKHRAPDAYILSSRDSWDDGDLESIAEFGRGDTRDDVRSWIAEHTPDAFTVVISIDAPESDPRYDDLYFVAMVIDEPNGALAFKMRFDAPEARW